MLYDGIKNTWLTQNEYIVLSKEDLFIIALLPNYSGDNIVGVFMEDDGVYHLQTTFAAYWLPDLLKACLQATNQCSQKGL